MPVSEETYQRVALEDPEGQWELHCGRLVNKPEMTVEHNEIPRALLAQLAAQLSRREYSIAEGTARLRIGSGTYYVPDLCVIPRAMVQRLRQQPGTFEVYEEAVPLVVEVWSPSTGEYDVEEKLAEYERRGDLEIWRIHPYERTLTAWRRQPDGSYTETLYSEGTVPPASLPGVSVELAALFE
jgi:Uma2 family endonuclease